MNFTRRAILQQAALLLASIGVSQSFMAASAHRYYHAIAKPNVRKLALLVGINEYEDGVCEQLATQDPLFLGCVTDIQLQRELLVHRFGFEPDDVVLLTNEKATRQAIEEKFLTHLVGQARPGDIVVFHFSGLGSQIQIFDDHSDDHSSDTNTSFQISNSLVPVDGILPVGDRPVLNDFTENTLKLLVRSLATEEVITVLDTGFGASKQSLEGGLRVRSRLTTPTGFLSEDVLALQNQLLQRLRGKKEAIDKSPLPGVLLTAARPGKGAFEGQWDDFSAGLLTYALTQEMWWLATETPITTGISFASAHIEQTVGEQYHPVLSSIKSDNSVKQNYRFKPIQPQSVDGVVTGLNPESSSAQVLLGGLPAAVVEQYGTTSVLQLVNGKEATSLESSGGYSADQVPASTSDQSTQTPITTQPYSPGNGTPDDPTVAQKMPGDNKSSNLSQAQEEPLTENGADVPFYLTDSLIVQVRSHDGIYIQVKPIKQLSDSKRLKTGQLVYEYIRVLPKNINLVVALDTALERIERVDATSALSGVSKISTVVSKEQPADILFGKKPPIASSESLKDTLLSTAESIESSNLQSNGSFVASRGYGLFYLSRVEIPNTVDNSEEAVKTAVNRLAPKFHSLLAAKMLRLTENRGSSRLGLQATLEMLAPQERILIQQTTFRAPWPSPENRLTKLFVSSGQVPVLPIGSKIHYRLQNYSDRPIYCLLLGLDSGGNVIAIYPTGHSSDPKNEDSPHKGNVIPAGGLLTLPQSNVSAEWTLTGPEGLAETYIICSHGPFKRTADEFGKMMKPMGRFLQVSVMSDPIELMNAVLADLNAASREESDENFNIATDNYALNMSSYASLNFLYRVASV